MFRANAPSKVGDKGQPSTTTPSFDAQKGAKRQKLGHPLKNIAKTTKNTSTMEETLGGLSVFTQGNTIGGSSRTFPNGSSSSNAPGQSGASSSNADLLFDPEFMDSDSEVEVTRAPAEIPTQIIPTQIIATQIIATQIIPTQVDIAGGEEDPLDASFVEADGEEGDEEEDGVEDLDREVPSVWNAPQAIEWDRSQLYVDEVAEMIRVFPKAKMCSALFALSCSLVFDYVSTNKDRTDKSNLYVITAETFANHMTTAPTKQHLIDHLFQYFPNNTWPAYYVDYINKLKGKSPTAKARGSAMYTGVGADHFKAVLFGSTVQKKYVATKSFVNMYLYPNYTHEHQLPSGHTKEQMLRALRRMLWPIEADARAVGSLKSIVSRRKVKGLPAMTNAESDAAFAESRNRVFRKLGDNHYPTEFLTFVLFSAPAPAKELALASLCGGVALAATVNPLGELPPGGNSPEGRLRKTLVGRKARRHSEIMAADGGARGAAGANPGGGPGGDPGGGPGGGPGVAFEIVHSVSFLTPLEKKIRAKERMITLLESDADMDHQEKRAKLGGHRADLQHLLEQQYNE